MSNLMRKSSIRRPSVPLIQTSLGTAHWRSKSDSDSSCNEEFDDIGLDSSFSAFWKPNYSFKQARKQYSLSHLSHSKLGFKFSFLSAIQRFLLRKKIHFVFTFLQVVADFCFIILYLLEIIFSRNHVSIFLIFFSYLSLVLFIIKLITCAQLLPTIFSLTSMLDLGTFFPLLFFFLPLFYYPYFLRVILFSSRLQRVIMLYKSNHGRISAIQEKSIALFATAFALFYLTLCFVHLAEVISGNEDFSVLDVAYFVVISLATVGYGDFVVKTSFGKIIIVFAIIVSIFALTSNISSLVEAWRKNRLGNGSFSTSWGRHVVVFGKFENFSTLSEILKSLLHSESTMNLSVVLMSNDPARSDVNALLEQPMFKQRVFYFTGSALNRTDLSRAAVRHAESVFILCDHTRSEDERNVLRTWSISQYAPRTPLHCYSYFSEYLRYKEAFASTNLCLESMKQGILAYNCIHKGVATLITNLVITIAPLGKYSDLWLVQYADGIKSRIYEHKTNPCFIGFHFHTIAAFLFDTFQIALLAVRVVADDGFEHVLLNPAEKYIFNGKEHMLWISQKLQESENVEKMSNAEFNIYFQRLPFVIQLKTCVPLIPSPVSQTQELDGWYVGRPYTAYPIQNPPLCYLHKDSQTLEDITIKDTCDLYNHVVLISPYWRLARFVSTIRSTHQEQKSIVIISKNQPTESEFEFFRNVPSIYIVIGDPRQKIVLEKAGIYTAQCVVIFAYQKMENDKQSKVYSNDFVDLESILIRHSIKCLVDDKVHVVVELLAREGLTFLAPVTEVLPGDVPPDINRLALKRDNGHTFYNPVYASGEAFAADMLDSVLFHNYMNPAILDIFKLLSGTKSALDVSRDAKFGVESSFLKLIPVPKIFARSTMKNLFVELACKHGIIALGLYRAPDSTLGNKKHFVYTVPHPEIVIKSTDLVFVLTSQENI